MKITLPQSQQSWEAFAVEEVVADCLLNQRLVEIGLWDKFIVDMNDVDEFAYSLFLLEHQNVIKELWKNRCI